MARSTDDGDLDAAARDHSRRCGGRGAVGITTGFLLAGDRRGLWRWDAEARQWRWITTAVVPALTGVKTLLQIDDRLFAGSEVAGVYLSGDEGATWTPLNAGLEGVRVLALIADGRQAIYAGTDHGVLRATLSQPRAF